MDDKRPSVRVKRPVKPVDDGFWDCSVCTYKNSDEAYKCEMCDVRKGTSTRKPKINPQIVAQQVANQFAGPLTPPPGSPITEDQEDSLQSFPDYDPEEPEPPLTEPLSEPEPAPSSPSLPPPPPPPPVLKKEKSSTPSVKKDKSNTQHKSITQHKRRVQSFRNIDRTSARHMNVTVDNLTVKITDYQPKKRKLATDLINKNSVQSDHSDTSSNASNDITEEHKISDNHVL